MTHTDGSVPDSTRASAREGGGPGHQAGNGGIFASLRGNPRLRALMASNVFFFGGVWTQTLILGWMVFDETGSEFLLAVFTSVRLLPLLLGPLAGVLADRFDRLRLLVCAGLWAFAALATLAALSSTGLADYWVLVIGGLALGLAHSPSQPARASLVFELVEPGKLSNATALTSLVFSATMMLGPAAGGALISWFGAPAALWISSGWYALALLSLMPLRGFRDRVRAHHESAMRMLFTGMGEIVRIRPVLAVLVVTVAVNSLMWSIYQGFMPVYAEHSLGLDAGGLGALLTCFGAGGIIGGVLIAGLGDFARKGAVFLFATGACSVCWALFSLTTAPVLAFGLMLIGGMFSAPFGALQTTLMLHATPPQLQGRAMGLQELAVGATPLASLLMGAVAQWIGMPLTGFFAQVLLIATLAATAFAIPELIRYHGTGAPDQFKG